MPDRTLILSDLHLGRPDAVRAATSLEPLLDSVDALVLNGDSAEIEHDRWRDAARREFDRLRELADVRGIGVTVLAGNHDPGISTERLLFLAGGGLLVTHGDAFHPAVAPWSHRARQMRDAWERAMAECEPQRRPTLDARLAAAAAAARAEWNGPAPDHTRLRGLLLRPMAAARILAYWRDAPRLAAEFAGLFAPQARTIVVGHSHWPGVRRVQGRTIVNTGAFGRPNTPHAAILEGSRLGLFPIHRRREGGAERYRLADRPRHEFDIAAPECTRGNPARTSLEGSERPSAAATRFAASSSPLTSMPVANPDPSQA